jgi:hypothetical protein
MTSVSHKNKISDNFLKTFSNSLMRNSPWELNQILDLKVDHRCRLMPCRYSSAQQYMVTFSRDLNTASSAQRSLQTDRLHGMQCPAMSVSSNIRWTSSCSFFHFGCCWRLDEGWPCVSGVSWLRGPGAKWFPRSQELLLPACLSDPRKLPKHAWHSQRSLFPARVMHTLYHSLPTIATQPSRLKQPPLTHCKHLCQHKWCTLKTW